MSNTNSEKRHKEIRNSKAFHDYLILDTLEAGLVLCGTEVKAIRAGKAQLEGSFIRIDRSVPILFNAHIDEYTFGNVNNHDPKRSRKLLLNKKEIRKIQSAIEAEGQTVVPLKMYFKESLIKVQIAICKGKKLFDKREDLKKKTMMREAKRYLSHRR